MQVSKEGSVRVDLVGGTLDIHPIQLILPNVVTLNLATTLKAKVQVEPSSLDPIEINSLDYKKTYLFSQEQLVREDFNELAEMTFICLILKSFGLTKSIRVNLESGSPAGAGLGGSSAMGITLAKALNEYCSMNLTEQQIFQRVQAIECRILNQGVAGYQDYQPALYGGVLAIHPDFSDIKIEQLYKPELVNFLEANITLVYSGISRQSGINNWEVYKHFFDGNEQIRQGMRDIAKESECAYQAIKQNNFDALKEHICTEGELRAKLFPSIAPVEITQLFQQLRSKYDGIQGYKMCGAGGGGCFIILHDNGVGAAIKSYISEQTSMRVLEFKVDLPVQ